MTRKEAEALVAANAGKKMCVAYKTNADGTLVHRPERRPLAVAALALGLAACTGHAAEVEYPGEHCKDPHGYEHECDDLRHGGAPRIPDADPLADGTSDDLAPTPAEAVERDVDGPNEVIASGEQPEPGAEPVPVIEDEGDDLVGLVSADYVPPAERELVGAVAVDDGRKAKRAERRAERRARRASR